MALTRSQLKAIYDGLPNFEKTTWAQNANYSSYQGLYRYLSNNGSELAYRRIVDALIKTIGLERFQALTGEEANEIKTHKMNPKLQKLLDKIFDRSDPDSYRHELFSDLAKRYGFDINRFFEIETQMTDMLQIFPNNDVLVEKIRVANHDIVNEIIVRCFAIPMIQERLAE